MEIWTDGSTIPQEFIYLRKKVKVYSKPNGIILYSTSNSNLPDSVPSFKPSTEKNTETETNTSTGLAQGSTEFVFGVACVYVSWKVLQGLAAFALGSMTGGAGYALFFVG